METGKLKQRHRAARDEQPEALRIRIHRALSWLDRAEREHGDPDAAFIFLWIAFNAIYASEFGFEHSEAGQANRFIEHLLTLDTEQRLHRALFEQFSGPIRTLIDNRFVFEPFWRAVRRHESDGSWEQRFVASRKRAMYALMNNETATLMAIVLGRLYVLRNQLIHGGATWNGSVNRAQVRDGAAILGTVLPIMLELLIDCRDDSFEQAAWPVV